VYTVLFTFHDELSKDKGVVGNHAKLAWPVLAGSDIRGMELNLSSFLYESGSSLKRLDIRAMADLSLGIAANKIIVPSCLNIGLFLLVTAHDFNALDEHSQMNRARELHHG
jgi:hypothetical protein